MSENNAFIQEIGRTILEAINMHHIDANTLTADTPLMGTGLGMDSVDLLEAVVAIETKYKVKVADAEVGKKYFQTLGTIAEFIQSKHGKK